MSCYHPMVMIDTFDMTDPKIRWLCEHRKMEKKYDRNKFRRCLIIPRELALKEGIDLKKNNAVIIPCGHCIGCRLDYSRIWAERCIHEADKYENNYFLTLTYDDEFLPKGKAGNPTLVPDAVSEFMKALRQKFKRKFGHDGIKFFSAGEYGNPAAGERVFNPHYHIILFNCPIPDLQERHPVKVDGKVKWIKQFDKDGEPLLFSPMIYELWDKKGAATLGKVTFESCAYVARYCCKKANPDLQQKGRGAKIYDDLGIAPEFVRMSRRPGIGNDYYLQNLEDIYKYDNLSYKRGKKVVNVKPGRYCDKLLKQVDEQKFYDIKKIRRRQFYDSVDLLDFNGHDLAEQNHVKEDYKNASVKLLKRTL